jgi:TnsA endonuclease N terminal/TnsA endonuclease C terminal
MNSPKTYPPARIIGKNALSVTGEMPDIGLYESTLERDLMEMLRFDQGVLRVSPQPLKIEFLGPDGQPKVYFPDGLIEFKPELGMRPILYEVKHRQDFRKNWKVLIPKFRAAKRYCADHGWQFEVYTEREIRTPYLNNVKFLYPYRERAVPEPIANWILQTLSDLIEADPDLLLCALCKDKSNRAELIPAIWHLVATDLIDCDLSKPLTMRSKISAVR